MKHINIAFCFDKNLWMQAGVAITSLLISAQNKCVYRIHCIVSDDVIELYRDQLQQIVRKLSPDSTIVFKNAGDAFKNGYVWGYNSTATYYRFMLHRMFPEVDKIIYSDVDVIFQKDLSDLFDFDLADNYIAAVKDNLNVKSVFDYFYNKYESWQTHNFETLFGTYVNIGVSLWNLKKIRETKIYEKWQNLITEQFPFSDQDIVNYTCQGKIAFLSPVYNAMAANYGKLYAEDNIVWHAMKNENIITEQEFNDVYIVPQIIHYIGPKPWNEPVACHYDIWWYIASQTSYAPVFLARMAAKNKDIAK